MVLMGLPTNEQHKMWRVGKPAAGVGTRVLMTVRGAL
jgi:hypothetical protein